MPLVELTLPNFIVSLLKFVLSEINGYFFDLNEILEFSSNF